MPIDNKPLMDRSSLEDLFAKKELLQSKPTFLSVLEENYRAIDNWCEEDKKRSAVDMAKETYEDLIAIYKKNYNF